ncbi:hypothetical protein FB451DRAFT_1371378 [Mycena latifolia]|nr:hypothetical protein FB451DRAFT_1371378 [Mycena latifolia]
MAVKEGAQPSKEVYPPPIQNEKEVSEGQAVGEVDVVARQLKRWLGARASDSDIRRWREIRVGMFWEIETAGEIVRFIKTREVWGGLRGPEQTGPLEAGLQGDSKIYPGQERGGEEQECVIWTMGWREKVTVVDDGSLAVPVEHGGSAIGLLDVGASTLPFRPPSDELRNGHLKAPDFGIQRVNAILPIGDDAANSGNLVIKRNIVARKEAIKIR